MTRLSPVGAMGLPMPGGAPRAPPRILVPRGLKLVRAAAGVKGTTRAEDLQVLGDDLAEHGVLGVSGPIDRSLEGHVPQVG